MRNSKSDNLRALFMFLVVLGHVLELYLKNPIARSLYFLIYSFHMPAFIYLSGLYASYKPKRLFQKIILPYVVFQILYFLFINALTDKTFSLLTPYWLLWYLPAVFVWSLSLPLIDKITFLLEKKLPRTTKPLLLVTTLLLSLLVGFSSHINREWGLSRIFVFYPFFLAGHFQLDTLLLKKKRPLLIISSFAVISTVICYAFYKGSALRVFWLYEAAPYAIDHSTPLLRFLHLSFAAICILTLFHYMTPKKIPMITSIGKHTMPIYLMHGFVIKWMGKYQQYTIVLWVSFLLLLFLFLYPSFLEYLYSHKHKNTE